MKGSVLAYSAEHRMCACIARVRRSSHDRSSMKVMKQTLLDSTGGCRL